MSRGLWLRQITKHNTNGDWEASLAVPKGYHARSARDYHNVVHKFSRGARNRVSRRMRPLARVKSVACILKRSDLLP